MSILQLRTQCLNLALQRAGDLATPNDILDAAEEFFNWLVAFERDDKPASAPKLH